jgi:hypothetical protein
MSANSESDRFDGELVRLFYELWEGSVGGREYLESTPNLPESMERLPRTNAGDVHRALRNLNRIGHLVEKGPLSADFVASLVGKEAIRAIVRAKPLIEETRTRREEPDYLEFVDSLYQVCQRAYPDYEPTYHIEEKRGFGLVG